MKTNGFRGFAKRTERGVNFRIRAMRPMPAPIYMSVVADLFDPTRERDYFRYLTKIPAADVMSPADYAVRFRKNSLTGS